MIKKYFFTLFPKNQVPIIRHSDIVTSRGGGEMKERNGRRREVSGRLPLIDNKEGISPRDCERGCNTATGSCLSVDRYYK